MSVTNGVKGPGEDGPLPLKRINDAYVLDWVGTMTPSFIGNFRLSFNRYIEGSRGDGNAGFDIAKLGFPQSLIHQLPVNGFFGRYEFSGYQNLGRYFNFNYTNTWAAHPSFTKIWSGHSFKGGFDMRWIYYNNQNVGNPWRLTFDDGWRDNASHAFPLLQKHRVPASIFLSTDFIGSQRRFWWEAIGETLWGSFGEDARAQLGERLQRLQPGLADELRTERSAQRRSQLLSRLLQKLKDLPADTLQALADSCPAPPEPHGLDWRQVQALEASGLVRFGPHGASHAILTRLDDRSLERDLRRSHEVLGAHCTMPLPVYSYPNGDHDARVCAALARLGYRLALGTQPGLHRSQLASWLSLPRIGVSQHSARQPALLAWRILQGARAPAGGMPR